MEAWKKALKDDDWSRTDDEEEEIIYDFELKEPHYGQVEQKDLSDYGFETILDGQLLKWIHENYWWKPRNHPIN